MWKVFKIFGYGIGMKIYNNPSHMGVFGGRISQLVVEKGDKYVVWFDRGEWLVNELPERSLKFLISALEHIF